MELGQQSNCKGRERWKLAESMTELTTVGKKNQHRKFNATRAVCACLCTLGGLASGVLYLEAVFQLNPEPGTLSGPALWFPLSVFTLESQYQQHEAHLATKPARCLDGLYKSKLQSSHVNSKHIKHLSQPPSPQNNSF